MGTQACFLLSHGPKPVRPAPSSQAQGRLLMPGLPCPLPGLSLPLFSSGGETWPGPRGAARLSCLFSPQWTLSASSGRPPSISKSNSPRSEWPVAAGPAPPSPACKYVQTCSVICLIKNILLVALGFGGGRRCQELMFFEACHTHSQLCLKRFTPSCSLYPRPQIPAPAQFRWGLIPPESRSRSSRGAWQPMRQDRGPFCARKCVAHR